MRLPRPCFQEVRIDGGPTGTATRPRATPRTWDWRRASLAFLLSVFPGCGHFFVGRTARAFLWSALFLAVFMPVEILIYHVWSYTPRVETALWLAPLAFFLLCARGPTLLALRGDRAALSPAGVPGRSVHVLGTYAAVVTFGFGLEIAVHQKSCFIEVEVRSDRLEPFLSREDQARVLVSRYIEPVHGDFIYFVSPHAGAREEGKVGRVLARSSDSYQCRDGALLVNGVRIDTNGPMDRQHIEREGRREKRRRLLSFGGATAPEETSSSTVEWGDADWGPFVVPKDSYIILPDTSSAATGSRKVAWIVPQKGVRGRVVLRGGSA